MRLIILILKLKKKQLENTASKIYNDAYPIKNNPSKTSKKNKNPFEKWLKKRFRSGFSKMKDSFEEMDPMKTGQVNYL
jgi:hypothetical protein